MAKKEHRKALEGLHTVKTREDLEKQRKFIKEKREALLRASGIFKKTTRMEMDSERARRRSGATTDTVRPLGTDGKRIVWICLDCGARNVNYKKIRSRDERRKFLPRYLEYLKVNGESMTRDEAKMMIGRGAPYCIKCSQKKKKDVYMVRRTVKDILEDKLAKAETPQST